MSGARGGGAPRDAGRQALPGPWRILRIGAAVAAITLALDALVTAFVPIALLDPGAAAREADAGVYDTDVAWHRDARPGVERVRR